ncbi:MAG: bifunctional phosphoribosyl-AMP cyclohydrolase/phosphoribosyl-ATP diphosphatase HisIE [Leadbetterella sp.]
MNPIDFSKGLVVGIVQDLYTGKVLMQGFLNQEALDTTLSTGHVTFFSRSKQRLWTKGETSHHYLKYVSHVVDCDGDSILFKALPDGPTCHTGADTCWNEINEGKVQFIQSLTEIIKDRKNNPSDTSYTASLFKKGMNKIAQKVGEEAVEIVIEAKDDNKELFLGEAADLLFHYLVLLEAKEISLDEVIDTLISRHSEKK